MMFFRFSKTIIFLIAWVLTTSCVQQTVAPAYDDPIPDAHLLENAEKIYLAWNEGISGMGVSGDDQGIGGTGISDNDNGIGGTGIIGTISGFGSIIVNGIHIDYSPTQKLESPLGEKTAADLSVGQVVAVESETVEGKLIARRIIQQIALAGKVESVNVATREIKVGGESVLILPNENSDSLQFSDIVIGSDIAISGLRDTNTLYASHISYKAKNTPSLLSGSVTDIKNGKVIIDYRLEFDIPLNSIINIEKGDFVSIENIQGTANIKPKTWRWKRLYRPMFSGRVNRSSVEGFFAPNKSGLNNLNTKQKKYLTRQIIFKKKITGSEPVTIGTLTLNREKGRKLDFNKLSKIRRNRLKEDRTIEAEAIKEKQKKHGKNRKSLKKNSRQTSISKTSKIKSN